MLHTYLVALFISALFSYEGENPGKIFDVHLHGASDPALQIKELHDAGVYRIALSSSWELQNSYRKFEGPVIMQGLMFPCAEGKVPYSLQPCFSDNRDWPAPEWVEQQIMAGRIEFLGEILSQYYGISASDSMMTPYYELTIKYDLPVGIHFGGAGPDHGSQRFKMEMGDPKLIRPVLNQYPSLRLWIMHTGAPFFTETIKIMEEYKQVYTDISVISNPEIVPEQQFHAIMRAFIDAGLEDRLMFGTDNANIKKVIAAVEAVNFLSKAQKEKIYYQNAERFFGATVGN